MKLKIAPENLLERMALAFNLAPLPLVHTQVAFNAARTIMAAADTGIFEAIGKNNKNFQQIATDCKTDPAATKHLLDCLVGIGYLNWKNDLYSLKPKMHKWLLQESESNLIGKLRFQISEWNWMTRLEDYVRTGKPMELHSVITASEWSAYQEGMRDLSVNVAKELTKKIKLSSAAAQMLDIGGSHGLFSIELCKKYPSLSSTILELPGAIGQASAIAARHGLTDKIKYKTGNALTDELGNTQYDLIMINNVVHHFTLEENLNLAQKVSRALKPGGLYAIGEFIRQNKPGEGGTVASTLSLYFALISSSGTWSAEEINAWQKHSGLRIQKPVKLMTLPGWQMLLAAK
jgi:2-polyprenyl-3-methyl-5-hydroxy-6-metoxy-1,4-benzoquinol methylase